MSRYYDMLKEATEEARQNWTGEAEDGAWRVIVYSFFTDGHVRHLRQRWFRNGKVTTKAEAQNALDR